jgi:hypothetical protein
MLGLAFFDDLSCHPLFFCDGLNYYSDDDDDDGAVPKSLTPSRRTSRTFFVIIFFCFSDTEGISAVHLLCATTMMVSKGTTSDLVTVFPVTVSPVGFGHFYLSDLTVPSIHSFIHQSLM